MLTLEVPERELFDDDTSSFIQLPKTILQVEHSLVSLSKWEMKWCKPFITRDKKLTEEVIDYIRCMTITQNVHSNAYIGLPNEIIQQVEEYIEAPMTATWFNEKEKSLPSREVITAEIIYYWMIAQNIPMECQKWHLNRLLTLIRVCSIKNQPPKKQDRREMLKSRNALNAARRTQMQSKG